MVRLVGILKEALATLGNPPINMQQARSVRRLVLSMSRYALHHCEVCWPHSTDLAAAGTQSDMRICIAVLPLADLTCVCCFIRSMLSPWVAAAVTTACRP